MSLTEEDWSTWNFMQWFVKEQIEEETLAMNLLDKIKIAGGDSADKAALFNIYRELKEAPDSAGSALDVTAENP